MTSPLNSVAIANPIAGRIESLSGASRAVNAEQAQQLADDFESLFVSLVLKEMRQTLDGEGLFGGEASDTYGGLFDLYMGQHLAEAGGFGIGKAIHLYLQTASQP